MATTPMAIDSGATSAAAAALEALQQADDSDSDEFSALLPMAQGLAAGAAVLGAALRTVDNMLAQPALASLHVGRRCCKQDCLLLSAVDETFRSELCDICEEGNRLRAALEDARRDVPPVPITAPTGTRAPKLVARGDAAVAAPPRNQRRFLSDTHLVSKDAATRRAFLRRAFLRLHGERKLCVGATRRATRATLHDVYGRTPRNAPLIDEVGLRQRRLRGDRAARGLPQLHDISAMDPCCERGCCGGAAERTTPAARQRLWADVEAADNNTVAENDVLVNAIWCRGLGRTSSLCNTYFWRVTGFADGRCERVRALSIAHDGVLAAALDEHGSTGRRPANATSRSTVARLEEIIAKYTRPDPTRGYLICCNENFAGPEGLMSAMALEQHEAFESIHEDTAKRIIERYISRHVVNHMSIITQPTDRARRAAAGRARRARARSIDPVASLVAYG